LAYRSPSRSVPGITAVVSAVLDEATAMGLVAFDALGAAGREILADDPEAAAEVLDETLPPTVDRVVVQADLTVVAPGRLAPELAAALAAAADVESAGGATVFRVTADSLRRAFDAGAGREDLHRLFAEHSATSVPQALTYLIDDIARRHGVLRAGRAAAYVRCEDPALITAAIGAAGAAGLTLRKLAPTVAITDAELPALVEALRAAGLVPAAEDSTGGLLDLRPKPRRIRITPPTRTTWHAPAPPSEDQIAALVRRLQAVDAVVDVEQSAADVLATLRSAAGSRTPVWIGYADAEGGTSKRIVEPIVVSGGTLLAYDRLRRAVRTFALHRVSSAHADPGELVGS
jgi:predicted DNA-binding transcriptional regulator YafY